ncbi:MAG: hypothetical protein ACPL88_00740 [Bryobacteraceae bacterium]
MRRRLELQEERFELVLAVGLLVWRDPRNVTVRRHVLTAPAEVEFEPAKGLLTIRPAASFEAFRVEVDMLEDQPRLDHASLQTRLEELGIAFWDRRKLGDIFRQIANRLSSDAAVMEDDLDCPASADSRLRISYCPALVLRERRYDAYGDLVDSLLKSAEKDPSFRITQPWARLVLEGETSGADADPPNYPSSRFPRRHPVLFFPSHQ